jgi:hypothetical protein
VLERVKSTFVSRHRTGGVTAGRHLVASESSPDQLFAAVTEQVARVFDVPLVRLIRYEPDGFVGRRLQ